MSKRRSGGLQVQAPAVESAADSATPQAPAVEGAEAGGAKAPGASANGSAPESEHAHTSE
jgi:hypothetical protein